MPATSGPDDSIKPSDSSITTPMSPRQWLVAHADRAALLRGVSDPDPAIRFWACRLLDHHELDAEVANRMLAAMTDPNKKVRHAALHTLMCEACKPDDGTCAPIDVVGVAIGAMRADRSLRVRRAAAAALMWQKPMERRVRRAFSRVLRDETDPEVRNKAERALAYASAGTTRIG
jgi:HEAT repeat protein